MKLEGTNLLDTVSEDAFFVRENVRCLPFFVVNLFRCRADDYNRDKKVKGKKIAIVTNAGGLGVLGADKIANSNLSLAKFTSPTKEKLDEYYESYMKDNVGDNPSDLGAGISDERFIKCLQAIIEDSNVDGVIASPGIEPQPLNERNLINSMIRLFKITEKPVIVTLADADQSRKLIDVMENAHIPCYNSPERGVGALEKFMDYRLKRKSLIS